MTEADPNEPFPADAMSSQASYDTLKAHVSLFWQAEVENAERYASRSRVLIPFAASIFGLLVASAVGSLPRVLTLAGWIPPLIALPFGVWATMYFYLALRIFVARKVGFGPSGETSVQEEVRSKHPVDLENADLEASGITASYFLILPDELFATAEDFPPVMRESLVRTYYAALSLQIRNAQVRAKNAAGERFLAQGMLVAAISALVYAFIILCMASLDDIMFVWNRLMPILFETQDHIV